MFEDAIEPKQPQVEEWLGRLRGDIDRLHKTIDELSERLSPILVVQVSKEQDEKMPILVPLAETICMRDNEIANAIRRLRSIIDSVEL